MSLPAEILLDIVHNVDYGTLVALCFAGHSLHVVIQTNVGVLAKRRHMDVRIYKNNIFLWEESYRKIAEWRFVPNQPHTYSVAMKRMASYVGFHQLSGPEALSGPPDMPIECILSAAPALRFVEELQLWIDSAERDKTNVGVLAKRRRMDAVTAAAEVEQFTGHFARLRKLSLFLGAHFDWSAFLRTEAALKLPNLLIGYDSKPNESDLLRYCFDFSHLAADVGRRSVIFRGAVSRAFLMQCIRRFAELDRMVVLEVYLQHKLRSLPTDEFDVESLGTGRRRIVRFKSRSSQVNVFVNDSDWNQLAVATNDPSFTPSL
ncbi:hypothetical protein AAVH_28374 [Aphelenchoides avenae]|nr:hypothetical protein AAVH_28374 [Aphelenchus avenae]